MNAANSIRRATAWIAAVMALSVTWCAAAPYTWNSPLTGTGLAWDATNWGGGPPDVAGDVANLTVDWNSTTAAPTITLGANRTIGALAIDDTGASGDVLVTINSGNSLTFNNNGVSASLTSAGGANVINAPLSLTDNLAVSNATALTLGGAVTGNGGIVKSGAGQLNINATSPFSGGLTVSSGTVQISSLTGSGSVFIANGATLRGPNNSGSAYINNTSAPLTVDGNLIGEVNSPSTSFTVGSLSGASSGVITLGRRIDSQNALVVNQTVDGEYAGIIRNNTTNPGRATFTKNGAATLTLSGNNNMGGTTTIGGGTLKLGHNNALGFGGRYHDVNAVLGTSVGVAGILDLNGFTVNEPVTLAGALLNTSATPATLDNGVAGCQASSKIGSTGTLTFTGGGGSGAAGNYDRWENGSSQVTAPGSGYTQAPTVGGPAQTVTAILSKLTLSGTTATIGGAGDLNINALIGGTGGFTKTGAGTLRLNGMNTYTGPTVVSEGALGGTGTITGTVVVASGAAIAVDLAAGGGLTVAGTVDLTAGNATLALSGTTEADEVILLTAAPISGAFTFVTGVPEGYGIRYAPPNQIVLVKVTLLLLR